MKLAIMQPYFLPYIGYVQLIKTVDKFILYDDVNYIKQGWINRNRVLVNNREFIFTLPLCDASSFKKINEIEIDIEKYRVKFLKTIYQSYKKAPFFYDTYLCLEEIMSNNERNLSKFITFSFNKILSYLDIKTPLLVSSEIEKNNELKAQNKVIDICNRMGADIYINAIGGKKLYSGDDFLKHNIELKFIRTQLIPYKQFNNEFVPSLSILDIMMFNSKEEISSMLDSYTLEQ